MLAFQRDAHDQLSVAGALASLGRDLQFDPMHDLCVVARIDICCIDYSCRRKFSTGPDTTPIPGQQSTAGDDKRGQATTKWAAHFKRHRRAMESG